MTTEIKPTSEPNESILMDLHLTPYLPYGLTLSCDNIHKGFQCPLVLTNLFSDLKMGMDVNSAIHFQAKPNLLPLDKLNNGQVIDLAVLIGFNVSPIEPMGCFFAVQWLKGDLSAELTLKQSTDVTRFLLSIHADVFKLIEKGEAIDKTLL
jgi:hypothetical protein